MVHLTERNLLTLRAIVADEKREQLELEIAAVVKTLEETLADDNIFILIMALGDMLLATLANNTSREDGVLILEHLLREFKDR